MSGELEFADSSHSSYKLVPPRAPSKRALSAQQIKQNSEVKQAFLKAVNAEFDGIYALEVAAKIGTDGKTPLAVGQVREAVSLGRVHRRLHASSLDAKIEEVIASLPRDTPQSALQKTPDLIAAVRREVDDLDALPSAYVLREIAERELNRLPSSVRAPKRPATGLSLSTAPGKRPVSASIALRGGRELSEALRDGRSGWRIGAASPATYFNQVRDKWGGTRAEWSINFAILQAFAANSSISEATRHVLDQRSLGYLYKFASGDLSSYGLQSTPLLDGMTEYHRQGASALSAAFRDQFGSAKKPGALSAQQFGAVPVSSPDALAALKRHFESANPTHRVLSATAENVGQVASQVIARVLDQRGAVLIDINHLLARIPQPEALSAPALLEQVNQKVADIQREISAQLTKYLQRELASLGASELEIAAQVRAMLAVLNERIGFAGTALVDGQPVVIVNDKSGLSRAEVFEALNHGGFTAGPAQIFENWTKLESPAKIVTRVNPDQMAPDKLELPHPNGNIDHFRDVKHFLGHKLVTNFSAMTKAASPAKTGELGRPPYVQALGAVTAQLLEGLGSPGINLDQRFADQKAGLVLQYLYNRILGHLENATAHRDDMAAFINDVQLIHEEIATIMAIAQPYRSSDLNLELPAAGKVKPRYEFKNSGMNAFNAVLSGVEAMKKSRALNVVTQQGSYYEQSMYVVDHSPHYHTSTLQGDKLQDSLAAITRSLEPGQKLDLYVGEFHHNISTERDDYRAENLIEQVRALLDADPPLVSAQFTVAIDTTINLTDAPEIGNFMQAFKKEIEDGKLNVVLFRSGQKFDMAGMDNFNAGLSATYNDGKAFAKYNTGAANLYQPSAANLQGMLHLEHSARKGLNVYRGAIMLAHRQLLEPGHRASLPRSLVGKGRGEEMLQIAPSTDPSAVFLDIRAPLGLLGQEHADNLLFLPIKSRIESLTAQAKLIRADRPSFGFPHLNLTLIPNVKLRINLGLESEADLERVRDMLVLVDQVGRTAHAAGADLERLKQIIGNSQGDALFDVTAALTRANLKVDFTRTPAGELQLLLRPNDLTKFSSERLTALAAAWAAAGCGEPARAILAVLKPRQGKLSSTQQTALVEACFGTVSALAQDPKGVALAHELLLELEGGEWPFDPRALKDSLVRARGTLIQKMVQGPNLNPNEAQRLIKANLATDPSTLAAAKGNLKSLFLATWESYPGRAEAALTLLDEIAQAPESLELWTQLARSPELLRQGQAKTLEAARRAIIKHISAQIPAATVSPATAASGRALAQIRRLLDQYRESAAAHGSLSVEKMMRTIFDDVAFAALFNAEPALRAEAILTRTSLAVRSRDWGRVHQGLDELATNLGPATRAIYTRAVSEALPVLLEYQQDASAEKVLATAAGRGVMLLGKGSSSSARSDLTRLMFQIVKRRPDVLLAQSDDAVGRSLLDSPEYASAEVVSSNREAQATRDAGQQQIAAIRAILVQLGGDLNSNTESDYRALLGRISYDFADFFRAVPDLGKMAHLLLADYLLARRDYLAAISAAEKAAEFVNAGQGAELGALVEKLLDAGAEGEALELMRRVAPKLPQAKWAKILELPNDQRLKAMRKPADAL